MQTQKKNIEDILDSAIHHIALAMGCDSCGAECKIRGILNHRDMMRRYEADARLGEIGR